MEIAELQDLVRTNARVRVRGAGSKPALAEPDEGGVTVDASGLSGVLEYEPGEYTFTALAGTPVRLVRDLLAEHGQYLPFDPPLAEHGATLGGSVAAGLSGPGRYRFGGVRDFILGVRFIDGLGEVVRSGGKVVKNAAGFDISKLMVGSLGQYGVLAELSFKVFPMPEATVTVRGGLRSLPEALEAMRLVYIAPLDVEALDVLPADGGQAQVWVRLGGIRSVLAARTERIRELLGGGEVLAGADEAQVWETAREFTWVPDGWALVKVPLSPARVAAFEAALSAGMVQRRYSLGGNLAWAALPQEQLPAFEAVLVQQELGGMLIFGPAGRPLIGQRNGQAFAVRVKAALDPAGRFPSL